MAPSVLIVDDEQAICDNLAAFLEDEGLQPLISHSGEDALELVRDGVKVDVCIMDLRLPGMTGTEAILAIRELVPQIRFVIHTGSANDKVIAELTRTGLEDVPVFNKPVRDMSRFASVVSTMTQPA